MNSGIQVVLDPPISGTPRESAAALGDVRPRIQVRGTLATAAIVNHDSFGGAWVEVLVRQRIYRNPTALPIFGKFIATGISFHARLEAARRLHAQLREGEEVTLVGHGIDQHTVRGLTVLRLLQVESLSLPANEQAQGGVAA